MGRTTAKAFTEVETFDDFKQEIQNSINYLTSGYFHPQGAELSIKSLNDMDEKTQKQLLRFMRHVDRKLSTGGAAKGNRFHKIPTVMAGCIYLTYYNDQIKDLSMDEFMLLSKFSIVEPPEFYQGAVDYLGKDLLTAVTEKHFDYMFQTGFLNFAEDKIRNGEDKDDVATFVRETPLEELSQQTFEYERNLLLEVGKYL
ncbi:MAG: hypothetical protein IJA30_05520 [Bacilli bacterium]|nr:hypothetical protein [Bacilli bacterium]